jgi:hypothetical protein
MDFDQVFQWCLDEVAEADRQLERFGSPRFVVASEQWEYSNGQWSTVHLDRYAGLVVLDDADAPASRSRVEAYLAKCATNHPLKYGLYPETPNLHAEKWLSAARYDLFEKLTPGSPDDDSATNVADRLLTESLAESTPTVETVFLAGPEEVSQLTHGDVVLRPPTGADVRVTTNQLPGFPAHPYGLFPSAVLERRSATANQDPIKRSGRIDDFLIALMLVDAQFMTVSPVYVRGDSYRTPGLHFSLSSGREWRGAQPITPDLWSESVVMVDRIEALGSTDDGRAVKRACERVLNSTPPHRDRTDQVIDLVVALESILTDTSRDQLGYQFRTFGALLMSEKFETRREIRDFLKKAYSDRSHIVHNNRPTKLDNEDLRRLLDTARQILRFVVEYGRPDFDVLVLGD